MEPPPSPRTLQNRDTISIQRILVLGGGGNSKYNWCALFKMYVFCYISQNVSTLRIVDSYDYFESYYKFSWH